MALTVLDCIEHIRHRLGSSDDGSGLSHDLSGLDVVNMAGIWLMSGRWKWAQGQMATLDHVQGQNYVALPADFKSLNSIETADLTSTIFEVTSNRLLELEKNTAGATNVWYYAVEWNQTGDAPVPQLRIWPTPDASAVAALRVYYRAQWAARSDDNQTVFLPDFMHPLFIELCREYALGWEEADQVPLGVRLQALKDGPLWEGAKSDDRLVQPSFGVLTNGMADEPWGGGDRWRFFEANGPS